LRIRVREVHLQILACFWGLVVCLAHGQVARPSVGNNTPDDGGVVSRPNTRSADAAAESPPAPAPDPVALRPIPNLTPVIRPAPPESLTFQWRPALNQSFRFLAAQHGFRFMTEPGTRSELKGPFFRDYLRSVRDLDHWADGDPFLVNYIGHPMMGAVTGYIQRQNDPRYQAVNFGRNARYWKSVARSLAFSAVYSTQFEIGPISESSLGNSGKIPGTQGFVDLAGGCDDGSAWRCWWSRRPSGPAG